MRSDRISLIAFEDLQVRLRDVLAFVQFVHAAHVELEYDLGRFIPVVVGHEVQVDDQDIVEVDDDIADSDQGSFVHMGLSGVVPPEGRGASVSDCKPLSYQEHSAGGRNELGRPWHIVRMSALDHPNIIAGLKGEPPPVQHAIQLATLERRIPALCQLVTGEPTATDIEWPPAWAKEYTARTGIPPRWWRPGPDAEATLLGRFPSQGAYSV
jgi:hypothetical protein